MPDSLQITVNDTRARSVLNLIQREAIGQGVKSVAGRAAVNLLQTHLRGLDASRANRMGGRRSHFYAKAANSTHFRLQPDGARVSITHTGFAIRYWGGTIHPVRGKALAIPARRETYGYWPRERSEKMFVHWPKGKRFGILATRAGASLRAMYFLVSKATIKPDKTLLPDETRIRDAVHAAMDTYLDRQLQRTGGPS